MTLITVSDEQARLIGEATTPIVLIDPRGRALGKLDRTPAANESAAISVEELAELQRRLNAPGPGKTTRELLDHLKSLAPIVEP